MTPILAAAALLSAAQVSPGCDLEKPSGVAGCQRAVIDRTVKMNQIQVLGTHNSYKRAIAPAEMALLKATSPKSAVGLDYAHPPLTEQLDAGARALELDVLYDPEGGRYADPLLGRLVRQSGQTTEPYDAEPMRRPGLKVLHVQDIDYRSNCALFVDCLKAIRAWSRAHPDHLPILITMNLKDDDVKAPGTVHALKFDAKAMDSIDAEIRSVFPADELITPDGVQGRYRSVRAAVRARGWPTLGQARGKVFFAMDEDEPKLSVYRGARHCLEGRVLFPNADEASPTSAYITLNDPIAQAARIRADVAAGLFVRTRADADTVEARSNDTARRAAAFASGAQVVSTDYMHPDQRFSSYSVSMPGGAVDRLDPAFAVGQGTALGAP
jgi:hypothetical protein